MESDEEESSSFDDIQTATHDDSAANGVTNGIESDDNKPCEADNKSAASSPKTKSQK